MIKKYYIESVIMPDGDHNAKAIISCKDHPVCVKIYGDKFELTERIIAILKGLNNEID